MNLKENKKLSGKQITKIVISAIIFLLFIIYEILTLFFPFAKELKGNIISSINSVDPKLTLFVGSVLQIFIVIAAACLLRTYFRSRMNINLKKKAKFTLFDGFVKYAAAIAVVILVLKAVGVDTGALLASVGILTIIVGLGAQPIIADIIAGIFIIFENEYTVGEIVSINNFRGTVIEIGVRSTKILDTAGNVKIINNSNISDVINLSRELSLAVVDCDFPYDVPLEKIENLIKSNLDKWAKKIPDIVEGPYYKGVCEYKDSNVTVKIMAKCAEENRFQVERDLLREYRMILVENDIDIAFPQVVINYPEHKDYETTKREKKQADKFNEQQRELSEGMDEQTN